MADLGDRKEYMGGSDAAAAVGASPFKTQLELYLEKVGEKELPDLSDNEKVYWGTALEDPIAKAVEDRYGTKLVRMNKTLQDAEYPFMRGHIDRRLSGVKEIAEIKAIGSDRDWGEPGTAEVPVYYLTQGYHYLGLMPEFEACNYYVLVRGQELRHYRVPRDDEAIELLRAHMIHFWERHVVPHSPPEATTLRDVSLLFPRSHAEILQANDAIRSAFMQRTLLQEQVKDLQERLDAFDLTIKHYMGEADQCNDGNLKLATWKQQSRTAVDQKKLKQEYPDVYEACKKTSKFRVFRTYRRKDDE